MTDPDRLTRAGRLLYGDWWHTGLATALGRNRRTVQRWATGERSVPDDEWPRIAALLLAHSREAAAFAGELERVAA